MKKMIARTVGRLAFCAAAFLGTTTTAHADIGGMLGQIAGGATDGSINPLDSNNKLGFHIDTGSLIPRGRHDTPYTFDDPTPPPAYRVDLSGNVEMMSANGYWIRTNRRAKGGWYPNGRAYWIYNGKVYPAAPQFDNHVLQSQYQNKLAADKERAQEQAAKKAAEQKLVAIDQSLSNAPQEQIDALVQRLPLPEQLNDRTQLAVLIKACRQDGLKTTGFEKLYGSLDRAVAQGQANANANNPSNANDQPAANGQPNANTSQPNPGQPSTPPGPQEFYAGNLGIFYSPVGYPDGTFGARITRVPDPNTPAGQIGLEVGDTILELDGQRLTRPEDVLAHKDQTTVDILNVRNNQPVQFNIFIP